MSSISSLFGSLHVWSLRKSLSQQGEEHFGVHIYHDKSGGGTTEDSYKDAKKQWVEARGIAWTPSNRRPEKLKDNLNDLEELLDNFSVANVKWKSNRQFQLILSNGALISLWIGFHFADVEKISIDKSLVGKVADPIHDAIIEEQYLVFSFLEKSKLAFVYFGKRLTEKKEGEKLSAMEPKVTLLDIPGPSGRKVYRKLSSNCRGDLICAWWPTSSEEAWPWSPFSADQGRVNMVLLGVSSTHLEVLCHIRTDSDPLDIAFSLNQPSHLYTVEQSHSSGGKRSLDTRIYEYSRNRLEKTTATSIPVKGSIIAHGRNHTEDKLLFACEDGTLIMYDDHRRLTQMTKTSLTPSMIYWHPTDTVVLVCGTRGELQVYDMALASVPFTISSEYPLPTTNLRLGQYFQNPLKLDRASWSCDMGNGPAPESIGCYDDLLLIFDRGPLCILRMELGVLSQGRLGSVELVSEYIQHDQELEAVNFLNSINWNTCGKACFACMTIIIDYLFRLPFNLDREGCIEDALGSFYAPSRPLLEPVVVQFRDSVSRIARRFFHHLLRHKRFEKAFLLAVDIGAKDLFMDIHYLASDMGNEPLAEAAKQRAMQIHQEEADPNGELDVEYTSDDDAFDDRNGYRDDYNGPHLNGHQIESRATPTNDSDYYQQGLGAKQTTLLRKERKYGMVHLQREQKVDTYPESNDEDEGEDPMAWALASRSGHVRHQQRKRDDHDDSKGDPGNSFKLIHFGVV